MPRVRVVVDVWTVPLTGTVTADPGGVLAGLVDDVLDPAERARATTLPGHAADRFVLGRVLLRRVLAARFGCAPGEVVVTATTCVRCGRPHGRVTVAPPDGTPGTPTLPGPVHVSVTRAGPVLAVATCDAGPVGIDVESWAAVRAAPLADVVLSAREQREQRERQAQRRGHHFPERLDGDRSLARAWVRKEAALKALGTGLDVDPSSMDLRRPPRGVRGVDAVAGESVAVADLRLPGRGAVGAVAVLVPDLLTPAPRGRPLLARAVPTAGLRAPRRLVVRVYDGVPVLGGHRS